MSKHTLLVSRISEGSTVDEVRQHFQYVPNVVGGYKTTTLGSGCREAYEDSDIMDVQMGYDVSKLTKLDKKRSVLYTSPDFCKVTQSN